MVDIVRQLRDASQVYENDHYSLDWEAADEIERLRAEVEQLRKVVFEACDVALVTISDEPACFGCQDAYEDWIESARFTPDMTAAVKRALDSRTRGD